MIGWVIAMEPADYEAWLAGGSAHGFAGGEGCEAVPGPGLRQCHRADGKARGPVLTGLYGQPVELAVGRDGRSPTTRTSANRS